MDAVHFYGTFLVKQQEYTKSIYELPVQANPKGFRLKFYGRLFIFTLDMFKILGSDADIDIRVFCISRKKDLNKI